jgi:hypothetical protein
MKTSTVIIITLSIASIPFGFYLLQFSDMPFSNNTTQWAEFGDYIGGLLNPILSAAAFVLLLKTISQNDKALRQNDEALKQTAEELALTRVQLEHAAQAQTLQADIDWVNQIDRKHREAQANYSIHIQDVYNSLLELSNRKFMRLESNDLLVSINCLSENRLNGQDDCLIQYNDEHSDNFNIVINAFLRQIHSLILQIKHPVLLETHPDKDTLIHYELLRIRSSISVHLQTLSHLTIKTLTKQKKMKIVPYMDTNNVAAQLIVSIRSNINHDLNAQD